MRPAKTAHHTRGRLRFTVAHSKSNSKVLDDVTAAITPLPGVRTVTSNPVTGSVTVHYDPTFTGQMEHEIAKQGCATGTFDLQLPAFGEGSDLLTGIEQEAQFLTHHSRAAREVVSYFGQLDQSIKRATDNNFDLKVLLPLGLASYAFFAIGAAVATPLWVTLGIFSFNSFVALHSKEQPLEAVGPTAALPPAEDSPV